MKSGIHSIRWVLFATLTIWLSLWVAPWQTPLEQLRWLRAGVSMLMFIVPGFCITQLLRSAPGNHVDYAEAVAAGFGVSVGLVGSIGLFASLVHLSFHFVYCSMFVIGGVGLLALGLRQRPITQARVDTGKLVWTLVPFIPLLAAMVVAGLPTIQTTDIHTDVLTYGWRVTEFRDSDSLGFTTDMLGKTIVLPPRLWLTAWPWSQAIIGEASGLHATELMTLYLPPIAAALSCLAVYYLGRRLGLSSPMASLGGTFQATLLMLSASAYKWGFFGGIAGPAFVVRMIEDKVVAAFVLTPIFMGAGQTFLQERQWRSLIVLILSAAGLALAHGPVFGMSCIILTLFGFIGVLTSSALKPFIMLVAILIAISLVPFSLRLPDQDAEDFPDTYAELVVSTDSFLVDRYRPLANDRFYGLDPTYVLNITYVPIAIALLLAAFQIRSSAVARYLLASMALIAVSVIPYTGWILGLALTLEQTWRVPWLTPYGLSMALLVTSVCAYLERLRMGKIRRWINRLAIPGTSLAGVVLAAVVSARLMPLSFTQNLTRQTELAAITDQLNATISAQDVVVGSNVHLNSLIPAMSAEATTIHFRGTYRTRLLGVRDAAVQASDLEVLSEANTSYEERLQIVSRYHVDYLLADSEAVWLENAPDFELVDATNQFRLYRFVSPLPTYNLLSNGGFERLNSNGAPIGWFFTGSPKMIGDEATAHSGTQAVELQGPNDGVHYRFDVESGRYLEVSIFVRNEDPRQPATGRLMVRWLDAQDSPIEILRCQFDITNTDGYQSITFVTDEIPEEAQLGALNLVAEASPFWVDDVSLVYRSSPSVAAQQECLPR